MTTTETTAVVVILQLYVARPRGIGKGLNPKFASRATHGIFAKLMKNPEVTSATNTLSHQLQALISVKMHQNPQLSIFKNFLGA